MYYLNAPFTDRRARRIVYRWRWNWSVSTSGAKRNNFPVARFRVRNAKHAASLLCTRQFNQLVFVQSARYPRISDHRWLVGIVRLYRQRDQIIRERADTLE